MREARHETYVEPVRAGRGPGGDVTPHLHEAPVPAGRGLPIRHLVARVAAFGPEPDAPRVAVGILQSLRVGRLTHAVRELHREERVRGVKVCRVARRFQTHLMNRDIGRRIRFLRFRREREEARQIPVASALLHAVHVCSGSHRSRGLKRAGRISRDFN